jgi:hypothetical protein
VIAATAGSSFHACQTNLELEPETVQAQADNFLIVPLEQTF